MDTLTWREGTERYLTEHSPLFHGGRTRELIEGVLHHFGIWRRSLLEGSEPLLTEIDRQAIEAYLRARLSQGRSPWTVNGYLAKIRAFLRWCKGWGLIKRDPTRGVRMLKAQRRLAHRIMAPEDSRAILRQLDRRGLRDLADLARLIVQTGLRLGEALTLRVLDVDLKARRLWARCREDWRPKDKEDRVIPLNRAAFQILERRIQAGTRGGLIFSTRTGKQVGRQNALRDLQREARKVGVERATFYGFRHLFATHQAPTMAAPALAAIMGHADIETTMAHYIHRDLMSLPTPAEFR